MSLYTYRSVTELPTEAVAILRKAPSPFLDLDWFRVFEMRVAEFLGKPLWLYVDLGSENRAILPMIETGSRGVRRLASMTNYYSPYYDLIHAGPGNKDMYREVVSAAMPTLGSYDVLDFSPLAPNISKLLKSAVQEAGWHCHSYPMSVNWRETNISSFEEYWSARSGQIRQAVIRKQRKLDKIPHEWVITEIEPTTKELADYHHAYFKSWKPVEPFPVFIDEWITVSSQKQELLLGLLYVQGKPVACQVWALRDQTAYIYKLAYDPAYHDLSPGTLLSARLFEHAIREKHITNIDYLTGNDAYKRHWTASSRPLYGLQVANPRSIAGKLMATRNRISDIKRNRLQESRLK